MLESLLGDRKFTLGVGRGIGRREYGGLMVDQDEARGRFDEGIRILRRALSGDRFSFHGEHFDFDDTALRPEPKASSVVDDLYFAGNSPESIAGAAELGLQQLIVPQAAWDVHAVQLLNFARLRAENGHGPSRPKSAVWIYCAETEAEAREAAEQYMVEYGESTLRHYELLGSHFGKLKGYELYAENAKTMNVAEHVRRWFELHPWGTPEQVIEKITDITGRLRVDEIMCVFRYGSMPHDAAERSLRLFAEEVMPKVKELDWAPIVVEPDRDPAASTP
jgi:alkanesulfonate monooxygenase SsuD/methylene tetrahydromethanopterin reductase-like flavin-dependent oxidoreductase (luciferase family)